MICISVTPTSRQLAKVDLLNAASRCDLIELCLDHLHREPDIPDLLSAVDKPVLISCRRKQDGGHFEGSEDDRQQLLRQAIVAGPAYIELDFDVAGSIPRFGNTQRVISYTSLNRPLGNVDDVFQEALSLNADVVKVTWPTPTLETAWPLLSAVSRKRTLPVVGLGIGQGGRTFSLLGRKYGSPWIYAALEQGMEAWDAQPTVFELDDVFCWREIDSKTKFVGVCGFDVTAMLTMQIFNRGFSELGLNMRSLPLAFSGSDKLPQMLDILKLRTLILDETSSGTVLGMAGNQDESVQDSGFADLLLQQPSGWQAFGILWRCVLRSLEAALSDGSDARPLDRRNVMVLGTGGVARALARGISRRKGLVSISGPDEKAVQAAAAQLDARSVPLASLYDTLADVVVIADPALQAGHHRHELNPAWFRPGMTIVDVAGAPLDSAFIVQARERGCHVVEPQAIYTEILSEQFKAVTGKPLPANLVARTIDEAST